MNKLINDLKENGFAPVFMSGCAGFLIGMIVMGLTFSSWKDPKHAESVVATTEKTAASNIADKEAAKAELERGSEIEGEDALNDIPEEYPRGYDPVDAELIYNWDNVKEDLSLKAELPYEKISFTAEDLKGRQGEVIFSKENDHHKHLKTFVAVPEIRVAGGSSSSFSDYGTLLVTTIKEDERSKESLYASIELILYNKDLLEKHHQLTFVAPEWGGIRLVGPTDGGTIFSYFSSERWSEDDAMPNTLTGVGHGAHISTFYWGGSYDLEHEVMATTTSIELYPELASAILEDAEHIINLPDSESFFSSDGKSFDLSGWLEEGSVIGKTLETDDQGAYCLVYDTLGVDAYVITIWPTKLIVSVAEEGLVDFEESRFYHGLYFEDLAEDKEMIKIEGTDFTLSRATLESLVYLLEDSGTDWHDINAQNLHLAE